MTQKKIKRRLRSDFTLGAEAAESDLLLEKGFYESGYYHAIANHVDSRRFIIGRTGSGKSALLQYLQTDNLDHVIRIDPEDLSLPYITNLGVIKFLSSIGLESRPAFHCALEARSSGGNN